MKGSFLGKTENGSEIVKYALSDAKDVLRVLDAVNKAVEGYSFCKQPGNYMRYVSTSGSPVLLAGTSEYVDLSRSGLSNYSAGSVYEELTKEYKDYTFFECKDGLPGIDLTEYLDDIAALDKVFSKFLTADEDFNLQMGERLYHMSWSPVIEDTKYVIKPECCPTFYDEWDVKKVNGVSVRLY